jgi:FtsZ-interacting cell division protein ZipA
MGAKRVVAIIVAATEVVIIVVMIVVAVVAIVIHALDTNLETESITAKHKTTIYNTHTKDSSINQGTE